MGLDKCMPRAPFSVHCLRFVIQTDACAIIAYGGKKSTISSQKRDGAKDVYQSSQGDGTAIGCAIVADHPTSTTEPLVTFCTIWHWSRYQHCKFKVSVLDENEELLTVEIKCHWFVILMFGVYRMTT